MRQRIGACQVMASNPSDHTTLTAVLAGYAGGGFDASFSSRDASMIECLTCGTTLPAGQFTIASLRRLEGASDPDDMIAVVAITCPTCKSQGVLVLGYGPMASAQDSDILVALRDGRGEDTLAADASPSDAQRLTVNSDPATADSAGAENG